MKRLLGYVKKYLKYAITCPLLKMVEAIFELISPLLVAQIVDVGVKNHDVGYIVKYGIIILCINIAVFVIGVLCDKFSAKASVGVATDMRKDVFKHVATFSHAELDRFGTASLINRLTNDINQVENSVAMFIRVLIRVPFLLIGAFVLSFVISPKMSGVFAVFIVVVSIILFVYMRRTTPYFKILRTKLDKISLVTKENLEGTRVIRAFNKQKDEEARFEGVTEDYTSTSIRLARISSFLHPMIYLIVNAAIVAILFIGGWQVNVGGLQTGDIIALIDYISIITLSLFLMSQIILMFVRTSASLNRINEVLNTEPSVKDGGKIKDIKHLKYNALLEFKNVCFSYTGNKQNNRSFIEELSFKLYPHQTLGIIGGTGSGKTTLASLMVRFYDVTSGEILYKGKNIKDFNLAPLRKEISIVQQRSTLFSGTLRENMKIRNNKATDAEIISALKTAQAWPFVSEWKNPLDYQIMADGKNVSGGQKQRLTIARALVGKPELLILDDSSSALDFLTEKNLRTAIKKLDTTTVIISQRATSMQHADLIIVLDNGDVVGMGTHKQLMKDCEIYKEIYLSQTK